MDETIFFEHRGHFVEIVNQPLGWRIWIDRVEQSDIFWLPKAAAIDIAKQRIERMVR